MAKKLLCIYGPTAIGKTRLALSLALRLEGELISADSRQIYQGMDIGTGKDLPKNGKFVLREKADNKQIGYWLFGCIPVWLLDIVKPNQNLTAYDWSLLAQKVIREIWQRGKLPILVGGTAFYLKFLLDGPLSPPVPPNWELRKQLETYSLKALQQELKQLWPERWSRMNLADRQNPRRLIRAIEIARSKEGKLSKKEEKFLNWNEIDFLGIALKAPLVWLKKKIARRIKERIQQGMKDEIQKLLAQGFKWSDPGFSALGYREWREFLKGKIDQKTLEARWLVGEIKYAKKQLRWFQNDPRFVWINRTTPGWQKRVENLVKKWYSD